MNIVVTMAGRGQRFVDAGFAVPKPLIPVNGQPMYALVTRCLPLDAASRLVFVCLEDHLEAFPLRRDIRARFGESAVVVSLDSVTAGQAVTAWSARDELDLRRPILIHNADTLFRSDLLAVRNRYPRASGILGVFQVEGDHWSFARVDADDRVVETAEKQRIAPLASTGLYYFAKASRFGELVEHEIAQHHHGEIYIAPLFNQLIFNGEEVRVDRADWVAPLGTPVELEEYLAAFGA